MSDELKDKTQQFFNDVEAILSDLVIELDIPEVTDAFAEVRTNLAKVRQDVNTNPERLEEDPLLPLKLKVWDKMKEK